MIKKIINHQRYLIKKFPRPANSCYEQYYTRSYQWITTVIYNIKVWIALRNTGSQIKQCFLTNQKTHHNNKK